MIADIKKALATTNLILVIVQLLKKDINGLIVEAQEVLKLVKL